MLYYTLLCSRILTFASHTHGLVDFMYNHPPLSISFLCTLTYPHLSSRYAAASLTTAWSPFLFGTFHWPSAPWVVESIKDCALYVVRSVTLFPLFSPVNRLPAKAGRFAILDIHSFFALTSLRSVPAIMVAGKCTKRTTSSNLDKESVDERLR